MSTPNSDLMRAGSVRLKFSIDIEPSGEAIPCKNSICSPTRLACACAAILSCSKLYSFRASVASLVLLPTNRQPSAVCTKESVKSKLACRSNSKSSAVPLPSNKLSIASDISTDFLWKSSTIVIASLTLST